MSPAPYKLDYGIEVIAEYAHGPYVMCRIRPHPLFTAVVRNGCMYVRRSRAIMTAKLGRILLPNEHVHHANHNRHDDRFENLELLGTAEHNREHKLGSKRREESKRAISASLRKAFQGGRHAPLPVRQQIGEQNSMAKLTWEKVAEIRASNATQDEIAAVYGVSRSNIGMIRRGVTWVI